MFILKLYNRIDSKAEVEFIGNAWRDGDIEYKSHDSISIVFAKEKMRNTKLIIKIKLGVIMKVSGG